MNGSLRCGIAYGLLLIGIVAAVSFTTAALQSDPYEPNDSIEEATPIEELPFTTTDAQIATPDDQDVFTFELSEAATVRIDVDADTAGSPLDATLALLNAQQEEFASSDDANGFDPAIELFLEAGQYYIVIADYPGGMIFPPTSGPYSMSIDNTLEGDPYEPNDSVDAPYVIDELPFPDLDEANTRISTPDDQDVFAFELNELQTILVDIDADAIGSPLDSTLTLLNNEGEEIAFSDDSEGLDPNIEANLEAGRYFVIVADYEGPLGPTSSGPYTLSLVVIEDPHEPNDSIDQATRMGELPVEITDGYIAAEDQDVFTFQLGERSMVQADVDADVLGSSLDSTLTLLNNEGDEIAFDDDSDEYDPALSRILDPGRYFVAVQPYNGSTGRYELHIQGNQVISCQERTIRDQERELWDLGDLDPGTSYSIALQGPQDADFDLYILEVVSRDPMITAAVHKSISVSSNELISFTVPGERARPFVAAVSSYESGGDYSLCLFGN